MMSYDGNASLTKCDGCTSNKSKRVASFISNEEKVDILVIGQSPGRYELATGKPFSGDSGRMINPVLFQYSTDVAYINVVSCRPMDQDKVADRTPTTLEVKSCRGRFDGDFSYVVDKYKPKIVLVFGSVAKKEVARLLKIEKYSKLNVHLLEHPAFIIRNRHLESKFITNIHNVLKSTFNNGGVDDIIDTFVTYEDSMREDFLEDVMNTPVVGVDIETNKLDMFDITFIIGTAAVSCSKRTYFFDGRVRDIKDYNPLINMLADDKVKKVFADVMFDVVAFKACGIEVNNYTDVFPLAFIYDNTFNEYNLEAITMRYFPELASYKSRFHSIVIDNNYLGVDTEELKTYNCFDSFVTRKLYEFLYEKLGKDARTAFDRITVRTLPVLVYIKAFGMKIDLETLDQYIKTFEQRYEELQVLFKEKYNIENINSTPQVSKWLFQDLKLKPIKFTDNKTKKVPSTDKEVIEAYASQVPDVKYLHEARRIASMLSYMLPAIKEGVDDCGVIHPRYKHYGIQSFRLSCSAPNLQGISRDKSGMEIFDKHPLRKLFVARHDDSYIVEFDYSQQEVRIVAELAVDDGMLKAFKEGKDVHRFVASLIFRKPEDQISSFERQIAKTCVFGSIFGASPKELSIRHKISEKEAKAYLDKFFELFGGIRKYIERQHHIVLDKGVISTVLGQPRRFIVHDHNRKDCEREAANHTIQAVAAGITFIALSTVYEKFRSEGLLGNGVDIIHTVHDSILFDVKEEVLEYVVDSVGEIMSSVPRRINFRLDFPVEYKIGKYWGGDMKLNDIIRKEQAV